MATAKDLDHVIHLLETALHKAQFARTVADMHQLETLSPGEFVGEILRDVESAAAHLRRLRQAYLCRPPAESPACRNTQSSV